MNGNSLFKHLFWFGATLTFFAFTAMMALIFIPIPVENREMALGTLGFIQGSMLTTSVGFLLTGNVGSLLGKKQPNTPDGTTTAEISATITTDSENGHKTDTKEAE